MACANWSGFDEICGGAFRTKSKIELNAVERKLGEFGIGGAEACKDVGSAAGCVGVEFDVVGTPASGARSCCFIGCGSTAGHSEEFVGLSKDVDFVGEPLRKTSHRSMTRSSSARGDPWLWLVAPKTVGDPTTEISSFGGWSSWRLFGRDTLAGRLFEMGLAKRTPFWTTSIEAELGSSWLVTFKISS